MDGDKKLNIGSGRLRFDGFTNIDITQYIDGNGDKMVDIVMDIEHEPLPYYNDVVSEIKADNVFEHLGDGFIFALNEMHRVLKEGGILTGCVPVAGTDSDFKDITHKRHFIKDSFSYLCGINGANPKFPEHPKYADYGVKPWNKIELKREGDMLFFTLSPRKV